MAEVRGHRRRHLLGQSLYWTDSGSFYPIVVWGAPLFGSVGLVGVIYPKQMNYPWLVIFTALAGLALGVSIHIRVYGF